MFQIFVNEMPSMHPFQSGEPLPCKVALTYFPVTYTNGLWKYIPDKIRRYLPGQKDSYTIESPPIRL